MVRHKNMPSSQPSSTKTECTSRQTPVTPAEYEETSMENVCAGSGRRSSRNALEAMGEEAKKLMQFIKELRALGIEDQEMPLPKICVVGGQSTGKSSLIEGMSQIKVPRADDVCTRCPVEIHLSEGPPGSQPWSCKVTLIRKYTFDTVARKVVVSKNKPLGPWILLPAPSELDFCTLSNRNEVEDVLHRAHLATLNPQQDPRKYIPGNGDHYENRFGTSFSPNVIRLDIQSPGLPTLCFYDLPGVIEHAEDTHSVDLVKNLVRGYIEAENCIILHTQTMNNDMANSGSGRFIDQLHASDRTVGVLTKPDCISDGSTLQWEEILGGRRFKRKLGYFVVKNSSDPTTEHDLAREEELLFFDTQEPFTTTLRPYNSQFGTYKLQDALSSMLVEQIRASLPIIIMQINKKLQKHEDRLAQLPKPIEGNVSRVVDEKIRGLTKVLGKEINGGEFEYRFFSTWRKRATKLRDTLVGSYPLLVFPSSPVLPPQQPQQLPKKKVAGDPTTDNANPAIDSDVILMGTPKPSPRKHGATGRNGQLAGLKRPAVSSQGLFQRATAIATGDPAIRREAKHFTLTKIRAYIDGMNQGVRSRDIKITQIIHFESIEHWENLLAVFLEDTAYLMTGLLDKYLEEYLQEWDGTLMSERISTKAYNFLDEAIEQQKVLLQGMLTMEKAKLITMDEAAKNTYEVEIKEILEQQCRDTALKTELTKRYPDQIYNDRQYNDLAAEIAERPPQYVEEIEEMATARSYYLCASARFAEYVGLSVTTQLFRQMQDGLKAALEEAVGLNDDDANEQCKRLLEPDQRVVDERDNLLAKQARLQEAKDKLAKLELPETKTGVHPPAPSPSRRARNTTLSPYGGNNRRAAYEDLT